MSASGGYVLVAALKVLNAALPERLDKMIADAVVRMQETSRGW